VFLTPLLLFCRSCSTRQAAAVSGLFVLLISIAGLAGLWLARRQALTVVLRSEWAVLLVVLVAGAIGSRLDSRHWPVLWIRRCLAVVLVMASFKLLGLELVS